jgi:hypothetical protein
MVMGWIFVNFYRYGTWNELVSVVLKLREPRRACVFVYGLLMKSSLVLDLGASGLLGSRLSGLVNCRLMTEYTPKCCCGVQADR